MPKKTKPKSTARSVGILIRVTEGERREIRQASLKKTLPVSAWVRALALKEARSER